MNTIAMRVLILGCGYVGLEVGRSLALAGHHVFGLRRSAGGEAELRAAGVEPLVGDVTQSAQLSALPGSFDWVVNTVSSSRGGLEEYRQAYLEGTRTLLAWLETTPPRCYVHTSSTSVYGQTDGSWVDETSPAEPVSPTGQILVATEALLRDAARRGFPAVIVRASGIYGPGRGYLFQQYLKNEARLAGAGDRFLNMIHRDDLAGALARALAAGRPGEIVNATDDEPVTQEAFFRWLSERMHKPFPPREEGPGGGARKRAVTNKRVSNAKLKTELGYGLKFPTFREGYAPEIRRVLGTG